MHNRLFQLCVAVLALGVVTTSGCSKKEETPNPEKNSSYYTGPMGAKGTVAKPGPGKME